MNPRHVPYDCRDGHARSEADADERVDEHDNSDCRGPHNGLNDRSKIRRGWWSRELSSWVVFLGVLEDEEEFEDDAGCERVREYSDRDPENSHDNVVLLAGVVNTLRGLTASLIDYFTRQGLQRSPSRHRSRASVFLPQAVSRLRPRLTLVPVPTGAVLIHFSLRSAWIALPLVVLRACYARVEPSVSRTTLNPRPAIAVVNPWRCGALPPLGSQTLEAE